MGNPDKRWSWGQALGRGVGPAIGAGGTAAVMGSMGGPIGAGLAPTIGAIGGFTGGFLGAALGYWWDAPPERAQPFGSAALFTFVVSAAVSALLSFLALERFLGDITIAHNVMASISLFSGFLPR